MKHFTLSLVCVVLFLAFTTATADVIEDDKEDGLPSDEFQLLSKSDIEEDGHPSEESQLLSQADNEKDLSTERAPRTPIRFRFRRSRRSSRRSTRRSSSRRSSRSRSRRSRRPPTGCPTVTFVCSTMPDVCANMKNAIASGKPTKLRRNTNPSQIRRNRRASGCRRLPRRPGYNCDEYPFASSFEGGRGAVVKMVPIRENSMQGGILAAFYKRHSLGHGDCYRVRII